MKQLSGTVFFLCLLLTACPEKQPVPFSPGRCEVNLQELGLFSQVGTGARAERIENADQLIGGQSAEGETGDTLLQNDKIRVIIQRPGRTMGPVLYGGTIVDADRQRPAGEPGGDQLGKLGGVHAFGRTFNVDTVEVLNDGSKGGPAVVAASGPDWLIDVADFTAALDQAGIGLKPVILPEDPLPIRGTVYYVLSPGESRVRILTAFCNEGDRAVRMIAGDIVEQGGTTAFFNPDGCESHVGKNGCLVDPASWFGFQGDDVAYGLRTYKITDLKAPEPANALYGAEVVVMIAGGESLQRMLAWANPESLNRPGEFFVRAGDKRLYLRDWVIGRDLGEISSLFLSQDGGQSGRIRASVVHADGTPAVGARVAVLSAVDDRQLTLLLADAQGKTKVDLPPGGYKLVVALPGHPVLPPTLVQLDSGATATPMLTLGASRTLTVSVKDPFGNPMPAKATVLCLTPICSTPPNAYKRFFNVEPSPTNVAAVGLVPPQGTLELKIPPGQYQVVVTRGPEYSAWPDTWPNQGHLVDLTAGNVAALEAVLAHVVDTTGWMGADLHVHAVGSPDSSVRNEERVLSFAAEGVDVLVSTDHDVVTDYAPVIQSLGAAPYIRSIIGQEVTPSFAHHNIFPLVRKPSQYGGPFDWAGGEGPTFRMGQLYASVREQYPGALIQMNHARNKMGALTMLKVDTLTGASHASAKGYRMEPDPAETADDTRLFSFDFDAIELQNGPNLGLAMVNDWMTFLSRGIIKTGTSCSDTHNALAFPGGYGRTYVDVGSDSPAAMSSDAFVQALKTGRAVGTNGPFVRLKAQRVNAAGDAVGSAVGIGETLSLEAGQGQKVKISVEVQTPDWFQFNLIELYSHAEGRHAENGIENTSWPDSRILARKVLDPLTLVPEAVEGVPGNFRRLRVTHDFIVEPTKDAWYVVMVRSQSHLRTMYPLAFVNSTCGNSICTPRAARPEAFTNPIFVDADGSGAYDAFPIRATQPLRAEKVQKAETRRFATTLEEVEAAWRRWAEHEN